MLAPISSTLAVDHEHETAIEGVEVEAASLRHCYEEMLLPGLLRKG
jgi:hypothetical protein